MDDSRSINMYDRFWSKITFCRIEQQEQRARSIRNRNDVEEFNYNWKYSVEMTARCIEESEPTDSNAHKA